MNKSKTKNTIDTAEAELRERCAKVAEQVAHLGASLMALEALEAEAGLRAGTARAQLTVALFQAGASPLALATPTSADDAVNAYLRALGVEPSNLHWLRLTVQEKLALALDGQLVAEIERLTAERHSAEIANNRLRAEAHREVEAARLELSRAEQDWQPDAVKRDARTTRASAALESALWREAHPGAPRPQQQVSADG